MIVVRVEQATIRMHPLDTQVLGARIIVGAAVHKIFKINLITRPF
jgi:hypothetical protein